MGHEESSTSAVRVMVSHGDDQFASIKISVLAPNSVEVEIGYCCEYHLLAVRDVLSEAFHAVSHKLWVDGVLASPTDGYTSETDKDAPF